MNKYKYANAENTAVNVTGDNNGFVPSTHRFWQEWGIADAIEAGEVEEYQTAEEIQAIADADVIREAKAYLAATDFKMTIDYDEDVPQEILDKRKEARILIRSMEDKINE